MNDLIDIQENLLETSKMLAWLSARAADEGGTQSFLQMFRSVEKRKQQLELELRKAAEAVGRAVCDYRIVPEDEDAPVPIAGLASTLSKFQSLYTIVYDAVRGQPKQTAKVRAEISRETELDFGYAMAGSVVVGLTVPFEPDLFDEARSGESIKTILAAARAKSPDEVLEFSRRLGRAPVRALFEWAQAHASFSFGVDITLRYGEAVKSESVIVKAEFERLKEVIEASSEQSHTESELTGELDGVNIPSQTFHFRPDAGGDIKGYTAGVIGPAHTVVLPQRYRIRVRKTTVVRFSTDQEISSYTLLGIVPLPATPELPAPSSPNITHEDA